MGTALAKQSPNRNKAVGRPLSADELLKQDPIALKPSANQPFLGVPVPKYNTQRPRVQDEKMWWRWDLVQRWRKVVFPRK